MSGIGSPLGFNDASITVGADRSLLVGGVAIPGTTAKGKLTTLMRALIASAAAMNPAIAEPLSPAPTWQASTAYSEGYCVRGAAVGSTDAVYLCVTAGTSAGAGGPTGIGAAGITDNTVRWLYIGNATSNSTYPLWSSVVPAASSDVMTGYLAVVAASAVATLGLSKMYESQLAGNFVARYTGGTLYEIGGSVAVRGPNTGTAAVPNFPSSADRYCFHIQTSCRKWIAIQPASHNPRAIHIEINGRPLTEGNMAAIAAVATGTYILNLSSFGAGVKDIKVYSSDAVRNVMFRMFVAADEDIWTPVPSNDLCIAFEGDSTVQTGGIGKRVVSWYIEALVAKQLGIERWYNNAVGGTGLIADGAGLATTYFERMDALITNQPDIVVLGSNANDQGRTAAEIETAFLTWARRLRAALPDATVFVVAKQPLRGDNLAVGQPSYVLEQNMQAAFLKWNDPNSAFIPLFTRTYTFPGTTADGWYYQAGGAAPFNDAHPLPRWYPAISSVIVEAVREFYNNQSL